MRVGYDSIKQINYLKLNFVFLQTFIEYNGMCKANGRISEKCDRDYDNIVKYEKTVVSKCSL
jgi:hypothetical protein